MTESRNAILYRLRAASAKDALPVEDFAPLSARGWTPEQRLARLKAAMEAVHTEFLDARGGELVPAIHGWLVQEALPSLIYGPATELGQRIAAAWPANGPQLIAYDRPMAEWKNGFFANTGAGLTDTVGGIAETGSLILWPGIDEPRTLSLVPPVHIAVLKVSQLYDTMWLAMQEQGWAARMPTNLLLVSGPSKTADIEQTLAYGVHGPKRLLVVLVD